MVDECPHEIQAFSEASRIVGFRSRQFTEQVKNTTIPNLLYAAVKIKAVMENSRSINRFRGVSSAPRAVVIDTIIKDYQTNLANEIDMTKYRFADADSMTTIIRDLSNILILD